MWFGWFRPKTEKLPPCIRPDLFFTSAQLGGHLRPVFKSNGRRSDRGACPGAGRVQAGPQELYEVIRAKSMAAVAAGKGGGGVTVVTQGDNPELVAERTHG